MIFLLHEAHVSWFVYGMLVVMLFSVGLLSIARCLPLYDSQDPREIVIDEVIGCFITCMWVPYTFHNACIGFVLFRLFDITKIAGVAWFERFAGAWGIVLDDFAAGVLSNMCLHFIMYSGIRLW
jgi:phosphatidylglycerophosphatase A